MDKGASALAQLILGNKYTQEQNQQQSDLTTDRAKAKADIDVAAKNKEQQNAVDTIKGMQDQGMVNDGGGATVNGVGISRGYNPYQIAHMQQGQQMHEMEALGKAAKQSIAQPQQDLETADMIHRLAENPSSVDMGTMQVMKARLALGGQGGRAISSALHAMGMDDRTINGDAQGWANFFTGNTTVKQTPQQIDAIQQGAFKLGDDAADRYQRAKQQFAQQAPMYAPSMAAGGGLGNAINSFTSPADQLAATHAQRKAQYTKQAAAAGQPSGLSGGAAFKQPQGIADGLKSLLFGAPQAAPSPAPAAGGNDLQAAAAAEIARRAAAKKEQQ